MTEAGSRWGRADDGGGQPMGEGSQWGQADDGGGQPMGAGK